MKRFIVCLLTAVFLMPLFSQNYGVVLSGGGGKGAYEIGVWRALVEYGIAQKTTVLSGTSVGGLNAALVTCLDQEKSEYLWKEIVPYVLTNDDEIISQKGLSNILDSVDLTYLQACNYPKIYVSAVKDEFTVLKLIGSMFLKFGDNTSRFVLNEQTDTEEIKNMLLATSAVPILTDPVKLSDGNYYVDGGGEEYGGDNTPVFPVYNNHKDIDIIVVVHLSKTPDGKISAEDYPDVQIVQIIPSIDLRGMWGSIDFTKETIENIMEQGYEDTVSTLNSMGMKPVAPYWFE